MRSLVTNLDFSDFTVYGGGPWGRRLARARDYTRTPVVPGLSIHPERLLGVAAEQAENTTLNAP
eukprot:scaffold18313_cov26-Phaeocystis_antarctica.AAC.1